MAKAKKLSAEGTYKPRVPAIGVFATCDPRIDKESRERSANIVEMAADRLAEAIKLPDGTGVPVVWSPILVDGEKEADVVASRFLDEGVGILVCLPDTWAFPQLTTFSFLAHFPPDVPVNFTCGNSGPKPGVVYTHAVSGALSQSGKLIHINVGNWPDTGPKPEMTEKTFQALVDWCYAAVTRQYLRGKRVVVFGHDSMGMETALAHVIPTRQTFGLEITRLDMKLFADMVQKKAYKEEELRSLRNWIAEHVGDRVELRDEADEARFTTCCAMYLVMRDILNDLNALGGGFMNQLEWGSDLRGIPLPVPDLMESLFNSSFDHNGRKTPVPFATEADVQGLLTMLFFTYITGGNPPLFMDFRKVWEPFEIRALAENLGVPAGKELWAERGFVDGDNSGSASFDWAAKPGTAPEEILKKISFPLADPGYFPGGGNSVTFVSPGGIEGIAGRLAYSAQKDVFSLIWDEAVTVDLPEKLSEAVCQTSTATWPHTFVVPKYATMAEYKQYAPANHFHMTWGLRPAPLEFWLDLCGVISATPWGARPAFVEGVDRPLPLLYLINGGEVATKVGR